MVFLLALALLAAFFTIVFACFRIWCEVGAIVLVFLLAIVILLMLLLL